MSFKFQVNRNGQNAQKQINLFYLKMSITNVYEFHLYYLFRLKANSNFFINYNTFTQKTLYINLNWVKLQLS